MITTTELSCGLTLVVERIPQVRSVGLMWLVPAGSARDTDGREGMSALWSEMLLRGAGELDSRAQADAFDSLGASRGVQIETFHHAIGGTVLGSRLGDALPLFVDMVRRPALDGSSLEPSRELCLSAIASLADDPQERVMLELRGAHAPRPINRSSLGTEAGIGATTLDELRAGWSQRAVPGGSVLALAGDVDADETARQLETLLDGWEGSAAEVSTGSETNRGYHHLDDETNQVHIALAHDAPPETSEDAWMERAVTAVLSGGMSGRLFTEVREKRSLCYSVFASYGAAREFGRTVAYVGTTPERAQESLDVLRGELERINTDAGTVSESELQRAKIGMKSRLVMSGESSGARAGALARDMHKLGRSRSLGELGASVDAITLDDVRAYLGRRSLGELTVASLGPAALEFSA